MQTSTPGNESRRDTTVMTLMNTKLPTAKRVGVVMFGIIAFFIFLMMKLPEARIQNLLLAHIRILSQSQGVLFSAEKIRVGMLLGPSLKLENIELKSIDDDKQTLKIDFLKVRPLLHSLLGQNRKASFTAELLGGEISGTVGGSATTAVVTLEFDDVKFDPAKSTLLKKFAMLELGALINGVVKLDLDFENPQKDEGKIDLKIEQLQVPPQSLMGFNLPKLGISKTLVEIGISQGQATIKNFEVGKDIKTDDIVARLTGEAVLDRKLDRSRLNVKAAFELSKNVIQGFPLLDALLAPAKTPEGKFNYKLGGTVSALEAVPGR